MTGDHECLELPDVKVLLVRGELHEFRLQVVAYFVGIFDRREGVSGGLRAPSSSSRIACRGESGFSGVLFESCFRFAGADVWMGSGGATVFSLACSFPRGD